MSKIKTKRERVLFASDNVTGACPEVLDAILKANDGDRTPYGNDQISIDLQNKFSEIFEKENTASYLQNFSAILVPGGFGERGAEGKIMAAKFAREKKVPFFGKYH